MQPGPLPRSGAQRRGRRKQKKKDILSDVLLGALEEIRTPDLLIRSQTLYPTELPAQVQDIYYHRPRGLSTVFAKKLKIFFAEQKRFFCPLRAAAGGPFFRPQTDCLLAPPCARGCPRAACGVPVRPAVPPCGLRCPHAPCGAPVRPGVSLPALRCHCRALRCPARPGMRPHAACDAPMRPCGAPCALAVPPARPGATLHAPRCPAGLPQPCGASRPRNTERDSPLPRSNSLPRPAAVLSPAQPHGREKARPLQKERPGLVHFAVRR